VEEGAAILDAIGTMQQILCSVSIFLCNTDYLPVRGVELQNTQKPIFLETINRSTLTGHFRKSITPGAQYMPGLLVRGTEAMPEYEQ